MLTEIVPDRAAFIIRMVGAVRGTPPELSRQLVLGAATTEGLYPHKLPTAHWQDIDLDLRSDGDQRTKSDFERCLPRIRDLVARVHDGVRRDQINQVAIFAIARIPLLIELGARLDDKLQTHIFQRHRRETSNSWVWPPKTRSPVQFIVQLVQKKRNKNKVALIVSLTGTIGIDELPNDIVKSYTVYAITPIAPDASNPSLISSRESLANFEATMRQFLARVEKDHGKPKSISLFPSVGVAAAVVIGRVLMPSVSPSWLVFDRDDQSVFFEALEVQS